MKNVKIYAHRIGALGAILIGLSVVILIKRELVWSYLFDIIGVFFIIDGIRLLIKKIGKKKIHPLRIIFNLILGALLVLYPDIPTKLVFVIIALYIIVNGIIRFVSYTHLRKNSIPKRAMVLWTAIGFMVLGLSIIVGNYATITAIMIIIGLYGLFFGLTCVLESISILTPDKEKQFLQKRMRIALPAIIEALLPRMMLSRINRGLSVPIKIDHSIKQKPNLKIFIHVTKKGFGMFGHCDIGLEGKIISYGNYDTKSIKLFDSVGDGVLFITDYAGYIPFCIKESQKTVFCYELVLSKSQLKQVYARLDELLSQTHEWIPSPRDKNDYIVKLSKRPGTKLYKFNQGRFKTFFVFGSNCVKLADYLVGNAKLNILGLGGIISPGSYQEYLENEYRHKNSIVVNKKILS